MPLSTISENGVANESNFVFTRYLYEKEEVRVALLVNILNKKEDESLFWGYELYYSGFIDELIQFLWKIYYDFFSTLNPKFESYLLNKLNRKSFANDNKLLPNVINNFLIRPFNMDVFMLDSFVKKNDEPENLNNINIHNFTALKKIFTSFLENYDYFGIGFCILKICHDDQLNDILTLSIEYFATFIEKLNAKNIINKIKQNVLKNNCNKRIIILSKILSYYSILSSLKNGKNIFVVVDEDDIIKYQTLHANLDFYQETPYVQQFPPYKILSTACIYSIDNLNYLSLFVLKRDSSNIVDAYLNNWLYYASFSPVWKERIQKYNGKIDHIFKKIVFDNDDNYELFCNHYDYEPDEQKKEIQDKSIQNIENKCSLSLFYQKHQDNCLIDFQITNLVESQMYV